MERTGFHRCQVFLYILSSHREENCSEAATSRTRTACNAAGHSKQSPGALPASHSHGHSRDLLAGRVPCAVPCAAAATIEAESFTPTEHTDLWGESRTFHWAL